MMMESIVRRILGAILFVDGNTQLPIRSPLQVTADSVSLTRNRSGLYIIHPTPPLAHAYRESFDTQPDDPAIGSLTATVTAVDPQNHYLPVNHTLSLPRDPNPDNADSNTSIFQPIRVSLYPSPTAVSQPGWAIVRLTILDAATDAPLPGAYIRIHDPDDDTILLAGGLSEWRGRTVGEAFIGVPNIPITTWNDGGGNGGPGNGGGPGSGGGPPGDDEPVVNVSQAVTITAHANPNFPVDSQTPPNPADLEANRTDLTTASSNLQIASGQVTAVTIKVPS